MLDLTDHIGKTLYFKSTTDSFVGEVVEYIVSSNTFKVVSGGCTYNMVFLGDNVGYLDTITATHYEACLTKDVFESECERVRLCQQISDMFIFGVTSDEVSLEQARGIAKILNIGGYRDE